MNIINLCEVNTIHTYMASKENQLANKQKERLSIMCNTCGFETMTTCLWN